MINLTRFKPAQFFVILAALWLTRIGLTYAGQSAAEIATAPAWLPYILEGLARLAGALMVLVAVALALAYGKQILAWFKAAFDVEPDQAPQPESETKRAEAITRDLSQTVINLARYGDRSADLIESVESQTAALVEIIKKLATKSNDQAEVAASFKIALQAIASKEPAKIALAAGEVRDEHIRNLMLLPYTQGDKAYWENATILVATQLGNAKRWQSEYSKMAISLMAEVSQIKTNLSASAAHLEAAETARPLLQARVNLETAGRYLRLPVSEQANPARLFGPQNEYVLGEGRR